MFSVNTDITDQMKGFSKFAKQDDVNHAMDEIIVPWRPAVRRRRRRSIPAPSR